MLDQFEHVKGLVDVAGILDSELGPSTRGRWLCPLHDDNRPSLSERGGAIVCWSCAFRGDIFRFLQEHRGLGPFAALAVAAEIGGVTLPDRIHHKGPGPLEEQKCDCARRGRAIGRAIEKSARRSLGDGLRRVWTEGQEDPETMWATLEAVVALERTFDNVEDKAAEEAG